MRNAECGMRKLRRCDFTFRKRARRTPPRCEDTPLYVATSMKCDVYTSFKKQSKTQAVQEARGKPEGAYIDVRNRGLPQRDAEMRRVFSVLLFVFLFAHHYPYRRPREIIGTANGVFEVALIREVQQAFVVDV